MQYHTKIGFAVTACALLALAATSPALAATKKKNAAVLDTGTVFQLFAPLSNATSSNTTSSTTPAVTPVATSTPAPAVTQPATVSSTTPTPNNNSGSTNLLTPTSSSTVPQTIEQKTDTPKINTNSSTKPSGKANSAVTQATTTATTSGVIVLPALNSALPSNIYASGLITPEQSRNMFLLALLSGSIGLLLAEGTQLGRMGTWFAKIFRAKPAPAAQRSRA